jgi:hypothetical protein
MRFRILFAMLGPLLLAGCTVADDVIRTGAQNSEDIARVAATILAKGSDDLAHASKLWGDDATRLSAQLFRTHGDDAGQIVAKAASRYGDDFASQGLFIDDLVLPILDDTDEYVRLVSQQDQELSLLSSILDDYRLENLAPDLLCLNLEKFITSGQPASNEDYLEFFEGSLLGHLDIFGIYILSEDIRGFIEAVAQGDSPTKFYYRLRFKSMCASLK